MPDSPKTPDDLLALAEKQFLAWQDQTLNIRMEAKTHRQYFDGIQWTAEEQEILRKRKQPCITDNLIQDKILFLRGFNESTRTDPRAFPRTKADERSAEAATDALRFVEENTQFDVTDTEVFDNELVEGWGAAVVWQNDEKDEIQIDRIRWDRYYFDPHSMKRDFSDKTFDGIITWMYLDQAQAKWSDHAEAIHSAFTNHSANAESTDDKPRTWFDTGKQRVQVFEHYFLADMGEGLIWHRGVFIKGLWLEEPEPSPYEEKIGNKKFKVNPIEATSPFVGYDGERYGLVRRYISLQDEVNKRRSKALHLFNSNQIVTQRSAFENKEQIRHEANRPDGFIEVDDITQFEMRKNLDLGQGNMLLLEQAERALGRTGPDEGLKGSSAPSSSGRSKQISQQGSAIALNPLFDSHRNWRLRIYRQIWMRIQQFWTKERWIRVRDEEGKPKFVGLNAPMDAETEAQLMAQDTDMSDDDKVIRLAQLALPNGNLKKQNVPAEMDVDILIEDQPDVVTLQAEQFENLVALAQAGVVFPQEVYLEAAPNIRNKTKLLDMIRGEGDEFMKQRQELQSMMERVEMLEQAANAADKRASARKKEAEADQIEVETARMVNE